ncbi:MAG: hypothetical protein JNM33_15820 [Rubrivivax sp.]|nr:hypothetical protein [Rubrivivax sp.]
MRARRSTLPALLCGLLAVSTVVPTGAQSPPQDAPRVPTRGELLYNTHCIACHSQQMHWRDKREAVDWPTLKAQVALWQERGALGWTGDDIQAVAAFLNDSIYRFPREDRALTAPALLPARWPTAASYSGFSSASRSPTSSARPSACTRNSP